MRLRRSWTEEIQTIALGWLLATRSTTISFVMSYVLDEVRFENSQKLAAGGIEELFIVIERRCC